MTGIRRAAARVGIAAAWVVLPLLPMACHGHYPVQAGLGGGGGGSGTLVQLVLSPPAVILGFRGTVQFAVSGTLSDGSSTVPSVTYTASGGTVNTGGFFTAGATAATDTVIATQLGGVTGTPPCCADTSVVTVTANPPAVLALTTQPGGAVSGVAFTQQPIVELLDLLDRPLAQSGVSVTASILSGTGTLGGNLTVTTDGQGHAVFSGLSITGAGNFTLTFSSPGLTSVNSALLSVSP
ncbi:MAG: hypothetical protein ACHQ52_13260 [Candidatus Eisenbacteria bacterium]